MIQLNKEQRARMLTKLVNDEMEYVRNIALRDHAEFFAYIERSLLRKLVVASDYPADSFDGRLIAYYGNQFAVDIESQEDIVREVGAEDSN